MRHLCEHSLRQEKERNRVCVLYKFARGEEEAKERGKKKFGILGERELLIKKLGHLFPPLSLRFFFFPVTLGVGKMVGAPSV